MKRGLITLILMLLACIQTVYAQCYGPSIREAKKAFEAKNYTQAKSFFIAAAKCPDCRPSDRDSTDWWIARCDEKINPPAPAPHRTTENVKKEEYKEVIVTKGPDEEYDFVGKYYNLGLAVVRHKGKYGFINKEGNVVVPIKYDAVGSGHYSNENVYGWDGHYMAVSQNGKWGYVNTSGECVVPVIYDDVDPYTPYDDGLMWVKKNGLYGCVNTSGTVVIPIIYENEINFYNNHPADVRKNGLWGFIDETGKTVIPFQFSSTRGFPYHGDLAQVCKNDKYGYINLSGDVVIPIEYEFADSFENELAGVVINGKQGFINTKGEIAIPCIYEPEYSYDGNGKCLNADFLCPSVVMVKKDGKYGIIDRTGQIITPFQYDDILSQNSSGNFKVKMGNEEFEIDKNGNRKN